MQRHHRVGSDARKDLGLELDVSVRRFDDHPVAGGDPAHLGGVGMDMHCRVRLDLAQVRHMPQPALRIGSRSMVIGKHERVALQ